MKQFKREIARSSMVERERNGKFLSVKYRLVVGFLCKLFSDNLIYAFFYFILFLLKTIQQNSFNRQLHKK